MNIGKRMALVVGLCGTLAATTPSWARGGSCGHGSAGTGKDIVDTAVAAGQFNTLVTAAKAAGLVETLKSEGPLTVFAPTDDAFAKLPAGTVEKLLAHPDQLAAILKYHVVAGKVKAADVVKLSSAKTVLGQTLAIDTADGVRVGKANVVKTDIETSNGVIHVIDTVLIPRNDIIETARGAGSFKTLLAALDAAGLTGALQSDGPFTVFAPTDEAFAKLPEGTVEALLKDIPKLKSILTYHVVSGKVAAQDVVKLNEAKDASRSCRSHRCVQRGEDQRRQGDQGRRDDRQRNHPRD
jgi:transforming growth factor-beta-induced protein